MIRYSLTCPKSHAFDGWFPSGDAFDKQVKRKLVACPSCGSTKVSKALMAPNVITSDKAVARRAEPEASPPVAPPPASAPPRVAFSPEQRQILKQMKALRDKVLAQSEYVGPRFADEARRIHNEEARERGIHGEASLDDVRALAEDGIDVFPIPELPEDQN
jgi:hypothetical protein